MRMWGLLLLLCCSEKPTQVLKHLGGGKHLYCIHEAWCQDRQTSYSLPNSLVSNPQYSPCLSSLKTLWGFYDVSFVCLASRPFFFTSLPPVPLFYSDLHLFFPANTVFLSSHKPLLFSKIISTSGHPTPQISRNLEPLLTFFPPACENVFSIQTVLLLLTRSCLILNIREHLSCESQVLYYYWL